MTYNANSLNSEIAYRMWALDVSNGLVLPGLLGIVASKQPLTIILIFVMPLPWTMSDLYSLWYLLCLLMIRKILL